jgi:hypothetical protein
MIIKQHFATLIGVYLMLRDPPKRDERGLSQSAETSILIAGAVGVALLVITLLTRFVRAKMAEI